MPGLPQSMSGGTMRRMRAPPGLPWLFLRHRDAMVAAYSGPQFPIVPALGLAGAVALLRSLQFLTQGWLWANWSVADVLLAWLYVLRDRIVVAVAIVLVAATIRLVPHAGLRLRMLMLAAAIAVGALAGETGLRLANDAPRQPLGLAALQWTLVALAIAPMLYIWRQAVEVRARLQSETLDQLRAQQQLAAAQLVALKNQIEPHFLFNTLATVRRLHSVEPAAGAAMLGHFIDYLRRAAPMLESPAIALEQELALVRAYLAVISVRMAGRLRVDFDVPATLQPVQLPPLVLATLVENAIKHGLTPAPEGGLLRIAGRDLGATVELTVEDSGVGFGAGSTGGSGIGLANARARLQMLFGSTASLTLETHAPRGVRAIVCLPRLHRPAL
jgi:signal transduction histidine kinase